MKLKKLIALLSVLILCLALTAPALYADLIWEPMNNSFYEQHREECQYTDKGYIAEEGTSGYEAPGDAKPIWVCEEPQTKLYISHVYTAGDGAQWGAANIRIGEEWVSCWIDLSAMTPIYDTRDFIADHSDKLTEYAGELMNLSGQGDVVLWNYPGGSDYNTTPLGESFHHEYASQIFTDENGDLWAYFPYIYGMEGWVYVPDPLSTEPVLLAETASSAEPTPSPAASEPTANPEGSASAGASQNAMLILCIAAVLLVVAVSIVLIVVFFVRNKNKNRR